MTKIYLLKNTSPVSSRQLPSISGSKLYSDRHIKCICQYIFGHVDTCCLSHSQVEPLPIPCDVKSPHTLRYIHIFDPPKLRHSNSPPIFLPWHFTTAGERQPAKVRLISNKWTTLEEKERHTSKYAKQLDQMCAQTTVISGDHKIQI